MCFRNLDCPRRTLPQGDDSFLTREVQRVSPTTGKKLHLGVSLTGVCFETKRQLAVICAGFRLAGLPHGEVELRDIQAARVRRSERYFLDVCGCARECRWCPCGSLVHLVNEASWGQQQPHHHEGPNQNV